jgi:Leucine-rich repeat (LRR) protein
MISDIIKTWLPGIFLISVMASVSMLWGQNTYVPDDNFEQALIDLGYDDTLDDYVLTANISGVTYLNIGENDHQISDLTGIEDFTALNHLNCSYNQLTSLDLSNNTALETLYSENNEFTSLDVSSNTALELLYANHNDLTSLDLSNNTALTLIYCQSNQLIHLNMKNGVTDQLATFNATANSLDCIEVNEEDVDWATENWTYENGNIKIA